jgi:hypothetical protein
MLTKVLKGWAAVVVVGYATLYVAKTQINNQRKNGYHRELVEDQE